MNKRSVRYAMVALGASIFAYGMVQFSSAMLASERYEIIHHEALGKASTGKVMEAPRQMGLLRLLESQRQQTHEHLSRGLFGAAGGMAVLALGVQGLLQERRRAALYLLEERRAWANDRCATSAAAPRVRVA